MRSKTSELDASGDDRTRNTCLFVRFGRCARGGLATERVLESLETRRSVLPHRLTAPIPPVPPSCRPLTELYAGTNGASHLFELHLFELKVAILRGGRIKLDSNMVGNTTNTEKLRDSPQGTVLERDSGGNQVN